MDKIMGRLQHEGEGDEASPLGRLKSMATTIGHLSSLGFNGGKNAAQTPTRPGFPRPGGARASPRRAANAKANQNRRASMRSEKEKLLNKMEKEHAQSIVKGVSVREDVAEILAEPFERRSKEDIAKVQAWMTEALPEFCKKVSLDPSVRAFILKELCAHMRPRTLR